MFYNIWMSFMLYVVRECMHHPQSLPSVPEREWGSDESERANTTSPSAKAACTARYEENKGVKPKGPYQSTTRDPNQI